MEALVIWCLLFLVVGEGILLIIFHNAVEQHRNGIRRLTRELQDLERQLKVTKSRVRG